MARNTDKDPRVLANRKSQRSKVLLEFGKLIV